MSAGVSVVACFLLEKAGEQGCGAGGAVGDDGTVIDGAADLAGDRGRDVGWVRVW